MCESALRLSIRRRRRRRRRPSMLTSAHSRRVGRPDPLSLSLSLSLSLLWVEASGLPRLQLDSKLVFRAVYDDDNNDGGGSGSSNSSGISSNGYQHLHCSWNLS